MSLFGLKEKKQKKKQNVETFQALGVFSFLIIVFNIYFFNIYTSPTFRCPLPFHFPTTSICISLLPFHLPTTLYINIIIPLSLHLPLFLSLLIHTLLL